MSNDLTRLPLRFHQGDDFFEPSHHIAGLQEILIDNHRFVGNVGWRQNHQSFEAARVTWDLTEAFTLSEAACRKRLEQADREPYPVSLAISQLSMVPAASSPASARVRRSGRSRRSHRSLVPVK